MIYTALCSSVAITKLFPNKIRQFDLQPLQIAKIPNFFFIFLILNLSPLRWTSETSTRVEFKKKLAYANLEVHFIPLPHIYIFITITPNRWRLK